MNPHLPFRPHRTALLLALGLMGLAGPAFGQASEAQMNAIKSNCRSDFMSNCRGVKTGGSEAFQCLKKNEASLSAACRTAVNAVAPAQPKPAAAAPAPAPAPTPAPAAANAAPPAAPPPAAAPVAAPAVTAAPSTAPKPAAQKPTPPKPAAAATAAPAQPSAAQQNALKQSCRNDFMAHCAGVQPGGAQALSCLQTNAPKLTPACKSAVAAIGGGAPAAKPAMAATTPPAAAAPAAPPAAAAMPAPRLNSPLEARLVKRFCFTDFKVLCKGVALGQGRAVQCLAANAGALSPGCKAAMAEASR